MTSNIAKTVASVLQLRTHQTDGRTQIQEQSKYENDFSRTTALMIVFLHIYKDAVSFLRNLHKPIKEHWVCPDCCHLRINKDTLLVSSRESQWACRDILKSLPRLRLRGRDNYRASCSQESS